MKNILILFAFFLIICAGAVSCAEVRPISPASVLKHSLGTDSLRRGMSKGEVLEIWGTPNSVNRITQATAFSDIREEWIYYAKYPSVKVSAAYLSKTRHLFFEGDALIGWE